MLCLRRNSKSAPSVGFPSTDTVPSSSIPKLAVELAATASACSISSSSVRPPKNACSTVIRFIVSVPVLSVQITVAAPIVSQACILRTSVFSAVIRRILYARLKVTLIANPSGTATTIKVTATMKNPSSNLKPSALKPLNSPVSSARTTRIINNATAIPVARTAMT